MLLRLYIIEPFIDGLDLGWFSYRVLSFVLLPYLFLCRLFLDFLKQLSVYCDIMTLVNHLLHVDLDIFVRFLYFSDYFVNNLCLVLFLLPGQLLLCDQVVLFTA